MALYKYALKQSRLDILCSDINDLAHSLGPGAKLPTVVQMRDQFGASVATIDNALTRLVDLQVVERRHGVGLFVSQNLHQKTICLIQDPLFPTRSVISPFWQLLLEFAQERASEKFERFQLHFSTAGDTDDVRLQESLQQEILSGKVHGVLAVGLNDATMRWLENTGIPTVAFACFGHHMVSIQGNAIVQLAVSALAEQGCTDIAMWLPREFNHESEIVEVYRESLARHGLKFRPDRMSFENPGSGQTFTNNIEHGYYTADQVLRQPRQTWPDGIIITEDTMTLGALAAMNKHNAEVGKDFKVATHANTGSPLLIGGRDSMIMVEVNPAVIVNAMYETLEALMNSQTPPPSPIWVEPTISAPRAASFQGNS